MMSVHNGGKEGNEEEYDPVQEEYGRPLPADVGQKAVAVSGEKVDALVKFGVWDDCCLVVVLHFEIRGEVSVKEG
jgi:hypothetical protein